MGLGKEAQLKAARIFCVTAAAKAGLKWRSRPAEKADKKVLPKKYRLSREEFKDVMKNGRLISGSLAGVLAHHPSSIIYHPSPKAGIIVSKKLSNKAVTRNKLKRRLRAALQIVLPEVEKELHFVILPNRRALTVSVDKLIEDLREILKMESRKS